MPDIISCQAFLLCALCVNPQGLFHNLSSSLATIGHLAYHDIYTLEWSCALNTCCIVVANALNVAGVDGLDSGWTFLLESYCDCNILGWHLIGARYWSLGFEHCLSLGINWVEHSFSCLNLEVFNLITLGWSSGNCKLLAFLNLSYIALNSSAILKSYSNSTILLLSSEGDNFAFLNGLLTPSLPVASNEVAQIITYAQRQGFEGEFMPWDFSYWSEKYKQATYTLDESALKPYFKLENCIDAVFGLATTLYGLQFTPRPDLPGYHKDVMVYDVTDASGKHLALFYADFFPRASKRGGAWMTEFRGQSIRNGVEERPLISIVTNFSKPTADSPSLLTHDELTTFLHEFGHSLHGMMAEGRYGSLTGTNVARDFVELPSQIMENWAFEPGYLGTFARHYQSGEVIPSEMIEKIVAAKNYLAAYSQVRQLDFGILDMAWHCLKEVPAQDAKAFEKEILKPSALMPQIPSTCISTSFSHIFSGGYSAGYYSYKWAEVLEADAFSLFKEKGIFNTEVSGAFRREILSKGSSEDEAVLYRNFRGHDPKPEALLEKLGIIGINFVEKGSASK